MNFQLKRRHAFTILIAVSVFLPVGIISYFIISSLLDITQRVDNSHRSLRVSGETLSLLKDAETGRRGYILTGKEYFLEPYNNAEQSIEVKLRELKETTLNHPEQVKLYPELEESARKRLRLLGESIEIYKSGIPGDQIALSETGKNQMDKTRALFKRLEELQTEELNTLKSEAAAKAGFALNIILLGIGIDVIVTILTIVLLNNYFKEKDKADKLLTDAKVYFESIMNTVREPLLVLDKDLCVVSANRAFYTTFRLKPEEIEGNLFQKINDYNWNIPALINILEKVIPQGIEVSDFEVEHFFPGVGRKVMKLNAKKVFRVGNNSRLILVVLEDITLRKEAQEAGERMMVEISSKNTELEDLNRELQAFNYSVSHDLRAPLRAIAGFTQILADDWDELSTDERKNYFTLVIRNTYHMSALIEDMLKLSRIEETSIRKEKVKMRELFQEAAEELSPGGGIKIEIQEKIPDAMGERSLIKLVITNYISNAVKYSRKKEKPEIKAGAYLKDNFNVYYISDNGAGFNMKYKEKLFNVFSRLHSQDEYEGTGVGLAIVKRVIKKHGGRVWAESVPDKGATFYFSLPRD